MRLLGGAFGLICCLAPVRAAAEDPPCPPAATVHGDEALAGTLVGLLSSAGISTTPSADCPAVDVSVEQSESLVRVAFRDRYNRTGERTVRDVSTAAAIVESWAYQEVDGGRAIPAPPPAPAPTAVATTTGADAPAAAAILPASQRTGLGAGIETAVANDGSTWLGAAVSGCARVSSLCVGGVLRAGKDLKVGPDSAQQHHRTSSVHAVATVSLPRAVGGFTISPGLGLGYQRLRAATDHMVDGGIETVDADNHALAVEGLMAVRRSLGRMLWVQLQLSADAAILRSSDVNTPRGFVRGGLGFGVALP